MEIDAQGNDFNVLKSFGDMLSIVEEGVVEASQNVDLYQGVNNRREDIVRYLEKYNFEILKQTNNDYLGAEINIHFRKKK
jgi:hypothetical protein